MQECWEAVPESRPSFKSLHARLSKLIDEELESVDDVRTSNNPDEYYNNAVPKGTDYHNNALEPDQDPQVYN